MNELIEHKIKDLLLRSIEFKINNKVYKKGKLIIFNTKHFYIKFLIEKNGTMKTFELPYPFAIFSNDIDNSIIFDYTLSCFSPSKEFLDKYLTNIQPIKNTKFFDNYLYVHILNEIN